MDSILSDQECSPDSNGSQNKGPLITFMAAWPPTDCTEGIGKQKNKFLWNTCLLVSLCGFCVPLCCLSLNVVFCVFVDCLFVSMWSLHVPSISFPRRCGLGFVV